MAAAIVVGMTACSDSKGGKRSADGGQGLIGARGDLDPPTSPIKQPIADKKDDSDVTISVRVVPPKVGTTSIPNNAVRTGVWDRDDRPYLDFFNDGLLSVAQEQLNELNKTHSEGFKKRSLRFATQLRRFSVAFDNDRKVYVGFRIVDIVNPWESDTYRYKHVFLEGYDDGSGNIDLLQSPLSPAAAEGRDIIGRIICEHKTDCQRMILQITEKKNGADYQLANVAYRNAKARIQVSDQDKAHYINNQLINPNKHRFMTLLINSEQRAKGKDHHEALTFKSLTLRSWAVAYGASVFDLLIDTNVDRINQSIRLESPVVWRSGASTKRPSIEVGVAQLTGFLELNNGITKGLDGGVEFTDDGRLIPLTDTYSGGIESAELIGVDGKGRAKIDLTFRAEGSRPSDRLEIELNGEY